jgi:signal transduction histidine kinase
MDNEQVQILYIDDEAENLRGFQFLYKKFYKIYIATSAEDGFSILENNSQIKLIIADQRMPKMTGVEFFEKASALYPDIIRIILTGYSDIEAIIKAINNGKIFKYVTKPWDKDELKLIIDNAIWSYNIAEENRNLIKRLTEANVSLEDANKRLEEANRTLEKKVEERTEEILLQNEELEKHRTKLEFLVHERTIDLIEAKEKAEQSDKLKSAFLANFSHEIRTPMNAIVGFSQLLFYKNIDEKEKREYIELIVYNSKHLLNLINEIIDISRIEAGEMILNFEVFELNRIIFELLTLYEEQKLLMRKPDITLFVNPEVNKFKYRIYSDEGKLRQILVNLIENAIKFTDNGQIEFGYQPYEKEGRKMVLFYVKDTGIGISDEAKGFIFERFRKAEPTKGKLYRGAGLGLAISKRLVELMGGEIWVESELNSGSTFYFTLPYDENFNASPEEEKPLKIRKPNSYNWKNKLILVAEDEHTNYKFIEKALQKTNISLLWAKNGLETLELIKKNKNIDLVLMDIRMPLMDGYEATKKIKEINKDIPIIAQTAFALKDEKEQIIKAGCNDYISKPFAIHELLSLIGKYFDL